MGSRFLVIPLSESVRGLLPGLKFLRGGMDLLFLWSAQGVGANGGMGVQLIREACLAPCSIPAAALGNRAFSPPPWLSRRPVTKSESAAICLK